MLLIGFGALALGGVHPISCSLLAVGAIAGLAWAWLRYAWEARRVPIGRMGLALLMALGWTFFQWVPLPRELVNVLSPHTIEAATLAALAADTSVPDWLSMSLSPTRTALSWLSLVACTAVFLMSADLARRGRGRALALAVEAVALSVLAVALAHALLGATAVYGLEDAVVESPFVSSFINPKHAGALLLMGSIVALGRWLEASARFHLVIAALLAAGVLATGSRSNLGALVLAWAGLLMIAWYRKRAEGRAWVLLLVTVAALSVLVLAVFPGVWSDVATSSGAWRADIERHWTIGAMVAWDHPWVGTGMGAFHSVAASAVTDFDNGLLDHAHNLPLQMVADWGLPASIAITVVFLGGFLKCVRQVWSNLGLVALGIAVVALALQNVVDFSLYVPGVGLSAAVVAGILSGTSDAMRGRAPAAASVTARSWPSASLASVEVGALVLATALMSHHVIAYGRDAYHARAEVALAEGNPRSVDLATLIAHHPHDYYAFRLAGRVALADRQHSRARGFLVRASELAPRHGGTSLDLARVAIAQNAEVTAVDYLVSAAQAGGKSRSRVLTLVAAWSPESGATAQFLASSASNALSVVNILLTLGKQRDALRVALRAASFHREEPTALLRAVEVAATVRDIGTVEGLAKRALQDAASRVRHPRPWLVAGHWAKSVAFELSGDAVNAGESLAKATDHSVAADAPRLLLVSAGVAILRAEWSVARRTLQGLEQRLGSSPGLNARFHQLGSLVAEADGRLQKAIAHHHRALTYLPGDATSNQALRRLTRLARELDTRKAPAVREHNRGHDI